MLETLTRLLSNSEAQCARYASLTVNLAHWEHGVQPIKTAWRRTMTRYALDTDYDHALFLFTREI